MKNLLSTLEWSLLITSGEVMAFMLGMRFLTDFLTGDQYFRTNHDLQNLHRTRVQFEVLNQIQSNRAELQEILDSILKK